MDEEHPRLLVEHVAVDRGDLDIAGALLATPFSGLPLIACGVLKIVYDVALLTMFRHVRPPEERGM